ncbi:hypothetical protein CBOM_05232 [Ceraceosorus bombacis]|uniref:Uncharacterized protein n=1 Tax=Ceraceosorus bombacis TaxID=401625 RepID=A0A0P1BR07_9BASI|nr:hypothetical protein CBOM_05232 [Ceraceosorus bombacis]
MSSASPSSSPSPSSRTLRPSPPGTPFAASQTQSSSSRAPITSVNGGEDASLARGPGSATALAASRAQAARRTNQKGKGSKGSGAGGWNRYYNPFDPRDLLWRFNVHVRGTYSYDMLNSWECWSISIFIIIISMLGLYSLIYEFPSRAQALIVRASYYLTGKGNLQNVSDPSGKLNADATTAFGAAPLMGQGLKVGGKWEL